jgi:hypothetical protein
VPLDQDVDPLAGQVEMRARRSRPVAADDAERADADEQRQRCRRQ